LVEGNRQMNWVDVWIGLNVIALAIAIWHGRNGM